MATHHLQFAEIIGEPKALSRIHATRFDLIGCCSSHAHIHVFMFNQQTVVITARTAR